MRYGRMAAAVLAGVAIMAGSGAGARSALATHYGKTTLFGGYSEKEIEPGVWKVTASANAGAGAGFGRTMAIYRAAELLSAQGFAYVQVIDQHGKETMRRKSGMHVGEFLKVTVRGAHGPEAPGDCRSKTPRACFTFPAATMMARLAPKLDLAPPVSVTANAPPPVVRSVPRAAVASAPQVRAVAPAPAAPLSDCASAKWGDGTSACR